MLTVLACALILDGLIGDPRWFYRFVPHPVVVMGKTVGLLDRSLNRADFNAGLRRLMGTAALALIVIVFAGIGLWLSGLLRPTLMGWFWEALLVSVLISQNSLYRHVADVATALEEGGLNAGRDAVGKIVGRDPQSLDENGVARAAIESAAENFSDGVAAPVLFAALFGLPGIMAYKAVNTADSMIGHLTDRHRDFGWAAARLDDLLNYIPARLSAVLFALASPILSDVSTREVAQVVLRDGPLHRSVNAGYPEAAMAAVLGIQLGGPRKYGAETVNDEWLGDGRTEATADDIRQALRIYLTACFYVFWVVAMAALLVSMVRT